MDSPVPGAAPLQAMKHPDTARIAAKPDRAKRELLDNVMIVFFPFGLWICRNEWSRADEVAHAGAPGARDGDSDTVPRAIVGVATVLVVTAPVCSGNAPLLRSPHAARPRPPHMSLLFMTLLSSLSTSAPSTIACDRDTKRLPMRVRAHGSARCCERPASCSQDAAFSCRSLADRAESRPFARFGGAHRRGATLADTRRSPFT